MKKILAASAFIVFAAGLAHAAKGEWTGYVTDTHCGAKGAAKQHTVACIEKCMKSGSKAQIWIESEKKAYDLDSFDKVKSLVGNEVTVKGDLDTATNTIKVDSAAKVAAK